MCHLRDTDDLRRELTGILTPRELDALLASTHRPNYCMQVGPPAACPRRGRGGGGSSSSCAASAAAQSGRR
jgi:hypothetical protein